MMKKMMMTIISDHLWSREWTSEPRIHNFNDDNNDNNNTTTTTHDIFWFIQSIQVINNILKVASYEKAKNIYNLIW